MIHSRNRNSLIQKTNHKPKKQKQLKDVYGAKGQRTESTTRFSPVMMDGDLIEEIEDKEFQTIYEWSNDLASLEYEADYKVL